MPSSTHDAYVKVLGVNEDCNKTDKLIAFLDYLHDQEYPYHKSSSYKGIFQECSSYTTKTTTNLSIETDVGITRFGNLAYTAINANDLLIDVGANMPHGRLNQISHARHKDDV